THFFFSWAHQVTSRSLLGPRPEIRGPRDLPSILDQCDDQEPPALCSAAGPCSSSSS
ncbi:unnamed protein product, partial [Pleuronectes platessa]